MACIALRIKANIFAMVYEAPPDQAPILSWISSPTGLLLIHFTATTLPPCCFSNTSAILLPQGFCTCYSFLTETLLPGCQSGSLPYLLNVFTQCLCLSETLLIRDKPQLPYQHLTSSFYVLFLSIALLSIWNIYLLFISPKRMLNFHKGMDFVCFV